MSGETSQSPTPGARDQAQVRSLQRGLDVLIAVNDAPPATVTRIVAQTGLPKATVVRILTTLRLQGYIAQASNGRGYRPLPRVRRLASAMMVENPFLTEARRRLVEFGQVTKWPSDLLLAEPDAMLIVTSNRDTAPIKLDRFEQRRFPLLESASGQAYLAAVDAGKREALISAVVAADVDRKQAFTRAGTAYEQIHAVRERGYSIRDYSAPIEGTRVLGVAIRAGGTPIGALALILLRESVTDTQLNKHLVPALQKEAEQLGEQHVVLAGSEPGTGGAQDAAEPIP